MPKEKINPCPFCGRSGVVITTVAERHYVECQDWAGCGFRGRTTKAKHNAIKAWNRIRLD